MSQLYLGLLFIESLAVYFVGYFLPYGHIRHPQKLSYSQSLQTSTHATGWETRSSSGKVMRRALFPEPQAG